MNFNSIHKKKGFTFFLVAFAAILFLVLLIFIWWTQIGEAGSSEIVQSACGQKSEYCTTTPQLELLGFLKRPIEISGQNMNIADALSLLVLASERIDKAAVGRTTGRLFENECFYLITKNQEKTTTEKISGPSDCDNVGKYSFIKATIYREKFGGNDLVIEVAVGSKSWKIYEGTLSLSQIDTIT